MVRVRLKKLLIYILVFITLFNFSITACAKPVMAATPTNSTNTTADTKTLEEETDLLMEASGGMDGIAGILTLALRFIIVSVAGVFNIATYSVAISAGKTDPTDTISLFITPFDIIFNKFTLTNINIFTLDDLSNPDGLVGTIRKNVSMWYYIVNAISIGLLLITLVIIAIKMATVSLSEEKARMKMFFADWLFSAALVLFMSFIVIGIININNAIIESISGITEVDVSSAVTAVRNASMSQSMILGFGATITYVLLTIQTLIFLIKYIFRLFKVILLVIISPIVPITYPISKMNGDKAGALNVWLYEFVDSVFTQLIHCIVYTVIVGTAFQAFAASTDISGIAALAPAIVAIFAMFFVGPAERLIRKIIGLDRNQGGVRQVIKSIANGARSAATIVNNTTGAVNNVANTAAVIGGASFGENLEVGNAAGADASLPSPDKLPTFKLPQSNNTTNNTYNNTFNDNSQTYGAGGKDTAALPASTADNQFENGLLSGIGDEAEGAAFVGMAGSEMTPESKDALERLRGTVEDMSTSSSSTSATDEHSEEHIEEHYEDYIETEEVLDSDADLSVVPPMDEGSAPDKGKAETELINRIKNELGLEEFEKNQEVILDGIKRIEDSIKDATSLEEAERLAEAEEGRPTEELAAACLEEYKANMENNPDLEAEVIDAPALVADVDMPSSDSDKDEAVEMMTDALAEKFKENPQLKEDTLDIVKKIQGYRGEADLSVDMTDEGLAEYAVKIATENKGAYTSNYDEAARQLETLANADLQKAAEAKGEFASNNLKAEQDKLSSLVSSTLANYDPKTSKVTGNVEVTGNTGDVIKQLEAGKK